MQFHEFRAGNIQHIAEPDPDLAARMAGKIFAADFLGRKVRDTTYGSKVSAYYHSTSAVWGVDCHSFAFAVVKVLADFIRLCLHHLVLS